MQSIAQNYYLTYEFFTQLKLRTIGSLSPQGMRQRKKEVTIYDLAKELNVSPSTVSRALNNHKSIGKKTSKAVKALAEQMGYRPNAFAASLRTNTSNNFGILVSWINRPFISSLISGIENEARERGYHTIISQSHDRTDFEIENLQAFQESRVSALIVSLAMSTKEYDHFELFTTNKIPVVFVDRIPNVKDAHKVHINNFNAAFEATEHLIEQGCKRIAHFGGDVNQVIYEDRRLGCVAALKKNNLEIDESLILEAVTLDADEGMSMAKRVLSMPNPPDGIFCANDRSAVSAIQYAKSQNFRIPEDLAIIGFNNDPVCEIIDPPLSSVNHPAVEMGTAAVRQVMKILDGSIPMYESSDTVLDTHVIVRKSSRKVNSR